jgi:hypothetical protein
MYQSTPLTGHVVNPTNYHGNSELPLIVFLLECESPNPHDSRFFTVKELIIFFSSWKRSMIGKSEREKQFFIIPKIDYFYNGGTYKGVDMPII